MLVKQPYKPFDVQELSLSAWEERPFKNNFFELVIVRKGHGIQCVNYNEYKYIPNSIFLLPPLKCHWFNILEPSEFIFLKFTSSFFTSDTTSNFGDKWFQDASNILSSYNQKPGDIIYSDHDRSQIMALINVVLQEDKNITAGSSSLIKTLMASILEIILRNIKKSNRRDLQESFSKDEKIYTLLNYIEENLDNPKLLTIENLSKIALISSTYLSEYFKKSVGMTLRTYMTKARLRKVEIRLLHSKFSLSEIADELGFTDVSHLSKTFKKYTGMSTKQFKANGDYIVLKRNSCA